MNTKQSILTIFIVIIAIITGSIILVFTIGASNQMVDEENLIISQDEIECNEIGGIWSDSIQGCFTDDQSTELPVGFIEEYNGRNIVKELELEHHYNPIDEQYTEPMAKAMFTIRNMTENERGTINQNLIFLALQNNGILTIAQQTILDMSMLVDRPSTLCIELKTLEYCSRLMALESMYRLIELNYTTDETYQWMNDTIKEMPTKNNLEQLRESLNLEDED